MKILLLISLSLLISGFDRNLRGGECVRGTRDCLDTLDQCIDELNGINKKLRECSLDQKKVVRQGKEMIANYVCNFLKIGHKNYSRAYRWPAPSRKKYNYIIRKSYDYYIQRLNCKWEKADAQGFLATAKKCHRCSDAINTCNKWLHEDIRKLNWCNINIADNKEKIERIRNKFACTIQGFLRHMPEGRRVLEAEFTSKESEVRNQKQCKDIDKLIKVVSETRDKDLKRRKGRRGN